MPTRARSSGSGSACPRTRGHEVTLAGLRDLSAVTDRQRDLLGGLAGVLAALGHAPFNFLPATLAGLLLAGMLLASVPSWRRGARLGWIMGTAYFAVTLIWIVEPFLVDIARHGWMAPFALAFMAGGLALFWALGFGLARWLSTGWAPVLLALTLPLAELGRTYLFTGFPWALVAYPWLDWGGIHWVSVIGSHGLSVLTLLAIGSLALGLIRQSKRLGAPGVLIPMGLMLLAPTRSEERRVGKECRSRWSPYH